MNAQLNPEGLPVDGPEPVPADEESQVPRTRVASWGWAMLAVLILAGGARTWVNAEQASAVRAGTEAAAVRSVLFVRPEVTRGQRTLTLPATLRGRQEAAIHARTNGYVKAWKKDIGDRVKQGEVLALIDTPEVDQDLAQTRATLQQIQARLELTKTSLARWESLRGSNAVSQQELDERRSAFQAAQADLAAARASVQRLEALQQFARIVAPFDGVVVRRHVEVGALVAAGSATANRELYYLAQDDVLRLTVAVPQSHLDGVKVGQAVSLRLLERPQLKLAGVVRRVAGGIDAATRSAQVEIEVPNVDGKLKPGGYVEVGLELAGAGPTLFVPPTAVQFRQDGPRVVVLNEDQSLSLRPVKLGRDLGRSVEVIEGLSAVEAVVLNPPDTVQVGERVHASEAPRETPKDGPKYARKG
ncbi:efflux RND transporter periplasmic adaptor subunit [uncultured Aquabacterium sp.]|jgi:RND family efflux transporter MFP subunit|uniref:efflux RND transporter periplasmic adaptor subunit n=1 Tax=uncultured Aquabacterium sp. TaxID=158753 RepID=UPI00262B1C98|nr:efflux RND transporter periplasmic adaptor subunit [uncultured Aquabacterium sp.]